MYAIFTVYEHISKIHALQQIRKMYVRRVCFYIPKPESGCHIPCDQLQAGLRWHPFFSSSVARFNGNSFVNWWFPMSVMSLRIDSGFPWISQLAMFDYQRVCRCFRGMMHCIFACDDVPYATCVTGVALTFGSYRRGWWFWECPAQYNLSGNSGQRRHAEMRNSLSIYQSGHPGSCYSEL